MEEKANRLVYFSKKSKYYGGIQYPAHRSPISYVKLLASELNIFGDKTGDIVDRNTIKTQQVTTEFVNQIGEVLHDELGLILNKEGIYSGDVEDYAPTIARLMIPA